MKKTPLLSSPSRSSSRPPSPRRRAAGGTPPGSIRHRPGAARRAGSAAGPPAAGPPAPPAPGYRPGVGAAIDAHVRHEIRREIRREIRDARRDRALFLGGLALLGAVTRSLPPRHTTVVVQGANYYYAEGTWYVAAGGQYRWSPADRRRRHRRPGERYVVPWGGVRYHYFNGAFYAPGAGGYRIVAPPPGVIVPGLPQGYVQQGNGYKYGGVAYREVLGPDGEPGFQVVGQP